MIQVMHQLKSHKDIICYKSVEGKGTLILCDDLGKEIFEVIGKGLRYKLVNHITKAYGYNSAILLGFLVFRIRVMLVLLSSAIVILPLRTFSTKLVTLSPTMLQ